MLIPKAATSSQGLIRRSYCFPRARDAFQALLQSLRLSPTEDVLLPAYIGWSAREGSGVYDPITALGLRASFYRVSARLHIDLEDLERALRRGSARVVVLIHYFGYPDPQYAEALRICREHGVVVVEDEAHAMLTDLILGSAGRRGDAAIYSLHKMLPVATGGLLVRNGGEAAVSGEPANVGEQVWEYDLARLARLRQDNARLIESLIAPLLGRIDPLWPGMHEVCVPQTYPVLVRGVSRDVAYERMNAEGFGVVSLYHTLIGPLRTSEFADSQWLAAHVMNLPVHHEASHEAIHQMIDALDRLTRPN